MRNFDLDQFWPILQQTTATEAEGREETLGESTPPPSAADVIGRSMVAAPPGLAHAVRPQDEPVLSFDLAPPPIPPQKTRISSGARDQDNATALVSPAAPPEIEPAGPARSRASWHAPVIWGGLGFLAGMAAWHVIGFWGFVSDAVFNGGGARIVEAGRARQSAPLAGTLSTSPGKGGAPLGTDNAAAVTPTRATAGTPQPCVAVALDRGGGHVSKEPCAPEALRDAGFNRRADRLVLQPRLQDPAAWSGTTAVNNEDPPDGAPSDSAAVIDFGTLKPTDFKLDAETKN